MTEIWKGKEVVDALNEKLRLSVSDLEQKGICPTLGILRVGDDPGSVAYEKGAMRRAESIGVQVHNFILPEETGEKEVLMLIEEINKDEKIHGLLIFRPLPAHIDDGKVRETLSPRKDVDGITAGSMAGVFMNDELGYPPCTARACMETLKYYGESLEGKRAVVIGRSLVVGKPVAMMLLAANATVTMCHTRTKEMDKLAREADILIVAAGKAKVIGESFFREDQVIIDVGINMDEEGKLLGDVDFDQAMGKVRAITPVPGDVGSVTTGILLQHVVDAAWRTEKEG